MYNFQTYTNTNEIFLCNDLLVKPWFRPCEKYILHYKDEQIVSRHIECLISGNYIICKEYQKFVNDKQPDWYKPNVKYYEKGDLIHIYIHECELLSFLKID